MFDQTDFLEASLSGSDMSNIRIDKCSFEDCNQVRSCAAP